jgi:hypothetical protein
LKRPWRTAGFDARGRAITVTIVQSRRPCRGKRSYRLYVEVRRDRGATQRLGDGCRNIGAPVLAVNAAGRAVLAWLEIPGPGAKKRVVVATGSTTRGLRAVTNSGRGDAAGHDVAINARGTVAVAYRRGSRMLVRVQPAGRTFGREDDLGATPQAGGPATAVTVDDTETVTVAWTDHCACGEAGMTASPNPLRVARGTVGGDFGATQTLDPGEFVAQPPQLAAARGVSAVLWGNEDGPTSVAVAPAGQPFGAATGFGDLEAIAVTVDGTPMVVSPARATRFENGAWSAPEPVGASGFPRALLTDLDGRTALLTQDGNRLRVSYRGTS